MSLTDIYFQFPLMILIVLPALEGVRREWREAADECRRHALPVLALRRLSAAAAVDSGAVVLLFGNAFSAYATPYALNSGYINLVPVLIGEFLNGDLASEPQLGSALAFGMIVVIGSRGPDLRAPATEDGQWLR